MKKKIAIMNPDRTLSVRVLRKKDLRDGDQVRHGDHVYFLDPDRYIITTGRFLIFWKKNYLTSYYTYGKPKPLPVPNFPEMENLGVSPGEISALFTPYFFRIITPPPVSWKERILFLMVAGLCCAMVYVIYILSKLQTAVNTPVA